MLQFHYYHQLLGFISFSPTEPEDLLGCPVDLVTEKALRAELRPFIEKEAVHV